MTDTQNGSKIFISKENLTQNTLNMTQDHFLLTKGQNYNKDKNH